MKNIFVIMFLLFFVNIAIAADSDGTGEPEATPQEMCAFTMDADSDGTGKEADSDGTGKETNESIQLIEFMACLSTAERKDN